MDIQLKILVRYNCAVGIVPYFLNNKWDCNLTTINEIIQISNNKDNDSIYRKS